MALPPVNAIRDRLLRDLGIPPEVLEFVNFATRFDARDTPARARGHRHRSAAARHYAWRLWDYWERNLDPDLFLDRSLRRRVGGQGRRGHRRLVGHRPPSGAQRRRGRRRCVILVARTREKLEEVARARSTRAGGTAHVHAADLSDIADVERAGRARCSPSTAASTS